MANKWKIQEHYIYRIKVPDLGGDVPIDDVVYETRRV